MVLIMGLRPGSDLSFHSAIVHAASHISSRKVQICLAAAGELEALLQRAARGRDELELRRLDEAEKRGNRFRCVVQVSHLVQEAVSRFK